MKNNTVNNKNWRNRNPQKAHCHVVVNSAVRNGTLHRQPCEVCNDPKADAHHEDYSQPLEIKWLCHKCHVQRHIQIRAEKGIKLFSKNEYDKLRYRKIYVKKGYSTRIRPSKRISLLGEAKRLRNEGLSYNQISKTLNISKGTAYKWLNKVDYK